MGDDTAINMEPSRRRPMHETRPENGWLEQPLNGWPLQMREDSKRQRGRESERGCK